jgi:hypothetical protein
MGQGYLKKFGQEKARYTAPGFETLIQLRLLAAEAASKMVEFSIGNVGEISPGSETRKIHADAKFSWVSVTASPSSPSGPGRDQ